jgi:hypothetical protein
MLFSGGDIYVEIHHEISRPKSSNSGDRAVLFEDLTRRYSRLIVQASKDSKKITFAPHTRPRNIFPKLKANGMHRL